MGSRERVFASLSHQQPDKLPYDILFTQKTHAKMVEFCGDPHFASKLGSSVSTSRATAVQDVPVAGR